MPAGVFVLTKPKKHWAHIHEITFVAGSKFLFWFYRCFGRKPFRVVLYPVVFFYYWAQPRARKASQKYLAKIKSTHTSLSHFYVFAESMLDKLLLWGNLLPLHNIQYFGQQCILDNLSQKRGGLFICAHFGNLELCRVFSKQTAGLKLTVLMHTKHAKAFNDMLAQLNPASQIDVIQVTEFTPTTAIELKAKTDAGEFVVIAGDRIPVSINPRVVSVPFLGENASFPVGPYIMAHLLQCPVYLIFSSQTDQSAEIHIESFRDRVQLPHKNRDHALSQLATDFANRLAFYCHKNPLQWFNFYDFWDTP